MEALTMETPMTEWNDDRLDELNGRMKEGFAEVDKRFDKVDARFDKVDERFVRLEGEMKKGFAKVDQEMKEGFAKVDQEMKDGFARVETQLAKTGDRFATREELGEVTMELRRLNDRFDRFLFIFLGACVGLVGSFLVAAFSLALQG